MKKKKPKWNRTHEWKNRKATINVPKEHPAYIFEKRGNRRKYLVFTSKDQTDGVSNKPLNKNIVDGESFTTYTRDGFFFGSADEFIPPKKKYRIDSSDTVLINSLKKKHFRKK